jgi:hypothetical protein
MTAKDFISNIFSRKSSIAAVGIFALVYIATVVPGQLAVDGQVGVSLVPMTSQGPAAGAAVDWKICAEITLITCLAICVQGILDYIRPRGRSLAEKLNPARPEN